MNLLHLKYAVEIAHTNSLNKAAEKLYVGQPNLSRAIKDLEASLGITIFERSAKGMTLTPDGEVFIRYAQSILKQVDSVEKIFQKQDEKEFHFSVSVPRANYVTEAFARFSKQISEYSEAEIFYKETNSMRTLKNVTQNEYKLGILRYAENFDRYYKEMMDEKGLNYELITEFRYKLLMSKENPLTKLKNITYDDLKDYIEIAHADPYVPTLSLAEVKKVELPDNIKRRIYVFERGSQFELLNQNPQTFMWVSLIPQSYMDRYGLVEIDCPENKRIYKDVLIYKKGYSLTELDKNFISQLVNVKREILKREK